VSEEECAGIRREVAERGRWRGDATVERKDGSKISVEVINVAVGDAEIDLDAAAGLPTTLSGNRATGC
jgi:hypothetical protein